MNDLINRLRSGATTSKDIGSHFAKYQDLCNEAADELGRMRKALEKVRSYNVDIHLGRINYRPWDHIQVIDAALAVSSDDRKDAS